MADIILEKLDQVYFKVIAERSTLAEMADHFSFKVPNAHFHPKVRAKIWNGMISLVNKRNNTIYIGLIEKILEFTKERKYTIEYPSIYINRELDEKVIQKFITDLKLPFTLHDHQYKAFLNGIEKQRSLILSCTASGKSLILYLFARYYNNINFDEKKTLIIVPTVNLVQQLFSDFKNYAKNDIRFQTDFMVHKIYSGQEKQTDCPIIISTWQSLAKLPDSFFEQFGCIICDEAHLGAADSIKGILSKCTKANYRFGTTGTLTDSKCNSMIVEGLTGPIYQAATTKQLIAEKKIANLKINCIVLKHKEEHAKQIKKYSYAEEIEFIITEPKRNKFIRNLASSLEGNTLVLFQYVAKHGYGLYTEIKNKAIHKNVYYIHGGTEAEEREQIRNIFEKEINAIIVASVGVFSVGANIPSLRHVIFSSPSKSRVRVLQSIGRGLRLTESKNMMTLHDIIDDLSYKKYKNFVYKHAEIRLSLYDSEGFDYNIYTIPL